MHRHGYKGRKFGRERDQREALMKSLSESLIIHESISTTLPKAKEVVPYIEKLITKAKTGTLANRRRIISSLQTVSSANKLVDDIAPRLAGRSSGHLRIEKLDTRRGDNAQIARLVFIFDDKPVKKIETAKPAEPKEVKTTKTSVPKSKSTAKPKSSAKKSEGKK